MNTDLERDLDLAVELVNTVYLPGDPPDRLTDVAVYQRILREEGQDELAGELTAEDLTRLRALRDALAPVFGADALAEASGLLNGLLREAALTPHLVLSGGTVRWSLDAGLHGHAALRARLLNALADHLLRHGTARTGVCDATPCTSVYVDRSRARTRRYCCDKCNDRAAASAYRHRRSGLR